MLMLRTINRAKNVRGRFPRRQLSTQAENPAPESTAKTPKQNAEPQPEPKSGGGFVKLLTGTVVLAAAGAGVGWYSDQNQDVKRVLQEQAPWFLDGWAQSKQFVESISPSPEPVQNVAPPATSAPSVQTPAAPKAAKAETAVAQKKQQDDADAKAKEAEAKAKKEADAKAKKEADAKAKKAAAAQAKKDAELKAKKDAELKAKKAAEAEAEAKKAAEAAAKAKKEADAKAKKEAAAKAKAKKEGEAAAKKDAETKKQKSSQAVEKKIAGAGAGAAVASAAAAAPTISVADHEAQLAEVEARFRQREELLLRNSKDEHDKLEERHFKDLENVKNVFGEAFTKERDERRKIIEDLSVKVAAFDKVIEHDSKCLQVSHEVHKLSMSIMSFTSALNVYKPFKKEMETLIAAGKSDPLVQSVAASIPRSVVNRGVVTHSQLEERFQDVSKMGRRAHVEPEQVGGLWGYLVGSAVSTLMIKEKGLVAGDSADARFSRAEHFLKVGDLEKAVEEMRALDGKPAKVARDWIKSAEERLAVMQAMDVLKSYVVTLEASVI